MLRALFCPDEYAPRVTDVDYKALSSRGIKGLVFDIDNTLEGYEAAVPSADTAAFLMGLLEMGFKICFASNNGRERVERFNTLAVPAMFKAGKPAKRVIRQAAALMGLCQKDLAIIGDQIFTDVLCGKLSGVYTILVHPVTSNDPWNVALKRIPERWIVRHFFNT